MGPVRAPDRRRAAALSLLAWLATFGCAGPLESSVRRSPGPTEGATRAAAGVALEDLVVTSGWIEPGSHSLPLTVRAPMMRAEVGHLPISSVGITFVYRGPTRAILPLASGELRRQVGLKLRAHDTCNVVYVMWHIEPTIGLHVAVKSNPLAHTHLECKDGGYQNVQPEFSRPDLAAVRVGEPRSLSARIDGLTLTVTVDGALAWRGDLPNSALAFDGPPGIRSDNAELDVAIHAPAE